MDIYIDSNGLKEYIKQLYSALRRDNDNKNNSIFDFSFNTILIDKIFRSQNIFLDISINKTVDDSIPVNERSLVNRDKTRDNMESILNELFKEESLLKNFFNQWYKEFKFSKTKNIQRSKFQNESSLSLAGGKKTSQNPNSSIDFEKDGIFRWLEKLFFVDGNTTDKDKNILSLNKTIYTRDENGWGFLSKKMKREHDIIVIDKYFFSDVPYTEEGRKRFLEALCGKNYEKEFRRNIVIFIGNASDQDCLGIINDFKDKCNLTCVRLEKIGKDDEKDWTNKLHDRLIISNYRIVCSGHSFPLYFNFDDNDKKNNRFSANGSMFITIGSVADGNNEKIIQNVLDYLQNHIIDCKDGNSNNYISSIYGEKITNLLNLKRK